jgi:hypothetical protein
MKILWPVLLSRCNRSLLELGKLIEERGELVEQDNKDKWRCLALPEKRPRYCLCLPEGSKSMVYIHAVNKKGGFYFIIKAETLVSPGKLLITLDEWSSKRVSLIDFLKSKYSENHDIPVINIKNPGLTYVIEEVCPENPDRKIITKVESVIFSSDFSEPVYKEEIRVKVLIGKDEKTYDLGLNNFSLFIYPKEPIFSQIPGLSI